MQSKASILVAGLAVLIISSPGCGARPAETHQDHMAICAAQAAGSEETARAARAQKKQGDHGAASRLYFEAATDRQRVSSVCGDVIEPCAYYQDAIAGAFVIQDRPLIASATDAFTACLQAHPSVVPDADARIALTIGAASSGRTSPFSLPPGAERLNALLGHISRQKN